MSNETSRGGMSSNPFGGESRIDRLNLLEFLESNSPSEKVLYTYIIQDAASNYLYAMLGKNGTSVEEFFSAHQYFFKVESTRSATWDHHRQIKYSYTCKGQKVKVDHYLTDSELKLMCFDKHYELSGLINHMDIDRFRSKLKQKRARIIHNNLEQVKSYINSLYQKELDQIVDGNQVPLQIWTGDFVSILVDPPTPFHLANLLYVPSRLKKARKKRARKTNKGTYYELAKVLKSKELQTINDDWGPLAELHEGINNVEITTDNSSCSPSSNNDRHSITS